MACPGWKVYTVGDERIAACKDAEDAAALLAPRSGSIIRYDRHHPRFKFGTIQYSRQLTSGEVAAYELTPVEEGGE